MKESRRVHVSRELLKQSVHYLSQYHDMFVTWGVKTAATVPEGKEREAFRQGIQQIFNEIQMTVAALQHELGESPKSIEEAVAALQSEDYKALLDKAKIQHYVQIVKKPFFLDTWKQGFVKGLDWVIALPIRGVLFCALKLRRQ